MKKKIIQVNWQLYLKTLLALFNIFLMLGETADLIVDKPIHRIKLTQLKKEKNKNTKSPG